ncbi:hypothetical protein EDD11_009427 [Mortierella claussenii]|nr:hypothetical protein EDD11_009427 [Mortierella claussenii]
MCTKTPSDTTTTAMSGQAPSHVENQGQGQSQPQEQGQGQSQSQEQGQGQQPQEQSQAPCQPQNQGQPPCQPQKQGQASSQSPRQQSTESSEGQDQQRQTSHHYDVDETAFFDGWATSGGTKLHKLTFSPQKLGPKDVEIRILNSGICASDIHLMSEDWCKLHGDIIPGHEIAGKVIAKGPEALYEVGDRVGATLIANACLECEDCKLGREQLCHKKTLVYRDRIKDESPPSYGGFAERIRLSSEFVYKIPDSIPLDEAAPLFCAGVTVYSALRRCNVGPTTVVGIKSIGNLGHLAIQFARAMDAKEVVAINDSSMTENDALELGALRTVDFSNPEQRKAEKHKMDVLLVNSFDHSTNWHDILALVANRGIIVVLALSKDPVSIPTMELIHRELKLIGSFQGGRKDVNDMLAFAAQHKIHPWLVKFPFDSINEAVELKVKGQARYAVVLEGMGQEPAIPHSSQHAQQHQQMKYEGKGEKSSTMKEEGDIRMEEAKSPQAQARRESESMMSV